MQRRIQQRHRNRAGQLQRPYLPAVAHHRDKPLLLRHILRSVIVLLARIPKIDAQQPPAHRHSRPRHLHPSPANRIVKIHIRRIIRQRQRQRLQLLVQRRRRVIPRTRNPSTLQVDRRQRLQHIVQLRRRKIDRHRLIARHPPRMFEEPDPVLIERDPRNRQLIRLRLRGRRMWFRMRLRSGCRQQGKKSKRRARVAQGIILRVQRGRLPV